MSENKQNNKLTNVINIILILLVVASILVCVTYMYYHYFVHDKTIGVNYINDQTPVDLVDYAKDLTEEQVLEYEKRVLFDINYFSNDANNGIPLQELRMNYFTDYTLSVPTCRSTGMQYVGKYEETEWEYDFYSIEEIQNSVDYAFTFYESADTVTWQGYNSNINAGTGTKLNRASIFIIKIDDKPYAIQLTGKYIFWEHIPGEFLKWAYDQEIHYNYKFADVFRTCMQSVKTANKGYGDYYVKFNMSDFFTVYEFKDGKFSEDTITDKLNTYVLTKVHYDKNGAVSSSQSLFGAIEGNKNYGNKIEDESYWKAKNVIYIGTSPSIANLSFKTRTSEYLNGDVAYLDIETIEMLNNLKDIEIAIYFRNIINLVGVDFSGFANLKNIKAIYIDFSLTELKDNTFTIFSKAFENSSSNTKIYLAQNINLQIADNAFAESSYTVIYPKPEIPEVELL